KFYRPGDAGEGPYDLSVDEIADPPASENPCCGDGEHVEDRPERPAMDHAEDQHTRGAAEDQAVSCQAADPYSRNQREVVAVKRPFVHQDNHRSAADKHSASQT